MRNNQSQIDQPAARLALSYPPNSPNAAPRPEQQSPEQQSPEQEHNIQQEQHQEDQPHQQQPPIAVIPIPEPVILQLIPIQPAEQSISDDDELADFAALLIADLPAETQPPAQGQQLPAAEQQIAPEPAPNHLLAEQILADQPAGEPPPVQPEQPLLIGDLAIDIQLPALEQHQPAAEQKIAPEPAPNHPPAEQILADQPVAEPHQLNLNNLQ